MNNKKICMLCHETDPLLSYFEIPTNERRNKWLEVTGLSTNISKYATLCSKHFAADSFANPDAKKSRRLTNPDAKSRCRLKKKAIPTLNLSNVSSSLGKRDNDHSNEANFERIFTCVKCGPIRDKNRSSHKFPISEERQNIWLQNLETQRKFSVYDLAKRRLCGIHFSPNDYTGCSWSRRRHLKEGANPVRATRRESFALISGSSDVEITDHIVSTGISGTLPDSISGYDNEYNENDVHLSPPRCSTSFINNNKSASCTEENFLDYQASNREMGYQTEQIIVDAEFETVTTNLNRAYLADHSYLGHKKKRICMSASNPRYIMDVRTPSATRRAKRNWKIAMKKTMITIISSQKKKISTLQQKLGNSLKRIKTLENIVIHLKRSKMISETEMKVLKDGFSDSSFKYLNKIDMR